MRPAMTDAAPDAAMPAEVGRPDDDTELLHRLVAKYGGHSVTIVRRSGQRLIGWSTSQSVAIADLREIVTSTALTTERAALEAKLAAERAAHAETKRERDQLLDKLHCMCGSPIDHSAWEGHTPVSVYDYSLDQERSRAEAAEARVAELEKALDALDRMSRGVDWCDQDEQARRWSAARRALEGGKIDE